MSLLDSTAFVDMPNNLPIRVFLFHMDNLAFGVFC